MLFSSLRRDERDKRDKDIDRIDLALCSIRLIVTEWEKKYNWCDAWSQISCVNIFDPKKIGWEDLLVRQDMCFGGTICAI